MFSINQVKEIHSQVKSGADFPSYIQNLIKIGVTGYDIYVADGQEEYFGKNNFTVRSSINYEPIIVADSSNADQFKTYLKLHQQGGSGYLAFCKHCAETGIAKWSIVMEKMTCTYYDKAGIKILQENIPYLN